MTTTADEASAPAFGADGLLARTLAWTRHSRWAGVGAATAVTVLAGILRLWGLGHPHELVFDETYYVKDAWSQWSLGYPAEWSQGADDRFAAGGVGTFLTTGSFVVHPPLGKWLIGLGMWIFGLNSSFGWRIAVALCGTATVLLVYLLARALGSSVIFATVAGVLMAVDGLAIVLSRVALLDGILTTFIALAFLFTAHDRRWHRTRLAARADADAGRAGGLGPVLWARPWLVAAGAAAGAATAVKWSGLYALAAIGVYAVVSDALARRQGGVSVWTWGALRQGVASFLLLVPVAFVVYLASWTGWLATDGGYDRHAADLNPASGLFAWVPLPLQSLWLYHQAMYGFNVGLTTPHSYASPAWQWPLLVRPTSMYWHMDKAGEAGCTWHSGCAQWITSIPNPIIWWAGVIACVWLLYLFVVRRHWQHALVLTAVASGYLPWLLFPARTIFQFYTVAMLPFMVLALTYALRELAGPHSGLQGARGEAGRRRRTSGRGVVLVFLGMVTAVSVYFLPLWTGLPTPYAFLMAHVWLPTWL